MNKDSETDNRLTPSVRRANLKKQYLSKIRSDISERERALNHLNYLVEFTRRLNMVECKMSNQPIPKPLALRSTDLFVCVEICCESIREITFLQADAEFWGCWTAFEQLLERVKSKDGSENLFEMAYLLFYIAALIFKRHIFDGTIEKEPQILSVEGYASLASGFIRPLFQSVESPAKQLLNLAENFESLIRA